MITMWDIYWITRLDEIRDTILILSIPVCILCGILTIISIIVYTANKDSEYESNQRLAGNWKIVGDKLKIYVVASVLLIGISSFIPTTKEAVAIYTIPIVANNEEVRDLPVNAVKFLNEKLKSWADDVLVDTTTKRGNK